MDSWEDRREYRALACLDRQEAARLILEQLQARLSQHSEAHQRAQDAASEGSMPAFSVAAGEAAGLREELNAELDEVRILLGGLSPQHQQLMEEEEALRREASRLRDTLQLSLEASNAEASGLLTAVQQSLGRLGLRSLLGAAWRAAAIAQQ